MTKLVNLSFDPIDHFLSRFYDEIPSQSMKDHQWSPRVNVAENKDNFDISFELPGVKKEDIKVSIEEGILNVEGEKKYHKEKKDSTLHRVESCYGKFYRNVQLPSNIDEKNIEASFNDGILHINVAKLEEKNTSQEIQIA